VHELKPLSETPPKPNFRPSSAMHSLVTPVGNEFFLKSGSNINPEDVDNIELVKKNTKISVPIVII